MFLNEIQKYEPAYLPQGTSTKSQWGLLFIDKKLIMKHSKDRFEIPEMNEIRHIVSVDEMDYMGSYDGHDCYCMRTLEQIELPKDFILVDIKEISDLSNDTGLFILAGAANHILHWSSVNKYCGCCGHKTYNKKDERAKCCSNCQNIIYPRISPAVITAIMKGNQILLAHNRNFRNGLYSLIAGYVEPGETLEHCVKREIQEEVGVQVKNIKYFSSQPWSFPDSLMMAFVAEYDSGEIVVDNDEITDAGWFTADQLPDIPSLDSIAGKMIRWYQEHNSSM